MSATPEELQVGQAETMSRPKVWPLVTQPSNRSTSFLKDSRLVNAYAERFDEGYQVEKRFGLGGVAQSFGAGLGQGMYTYDQSSTSSAVLFASNNVLYLQSLLSGRPTLFTMGAILTSTGFGLFGQGVVKFQYIPSGAGNYIILGSGNGGLTYYFGGGSGALTLITDPNFPQGETVPGFAVLDGTTYVMDGFGTIYGSANLNDPTVWSALNTIQANLEPDLGIALAKQLVYVVAFKSTSVQMFFDNGNAPPASPLSPVPGAMIKYGCLDANTLQDIDGKLLWVTNDKNNVSQVGMMESLQFKIISTPAIDRFLNLTRQTTQYVQSFTFRSWSYKYAGHRFYCLTNILANVSLVYDIDQGLWYQWTDANGNFYRVMSVATDLANNLLAQDYSTGVVNYLGPDYVYPNDNGTLFPVDIYTPNFTAGTDREKTLSTMYFNTDQMTGSKLLVRFSDDDYGGYNNFRQVDLGKRHPQIHDEGSFYRRSYHFRHLANTALRLRSVGLEYDIGTL